MMEKPIKCITVILKKIRLIVVSKGFISSENGHWTVDSTPLPLSSEIETPFFALSAVNCTICLFKCRQNKRGEVG